MPKKSRRSQTSESRRNRNREKKNQSRSNQEKRQREQAQNTSRRRQTRANPEIRQTEQAQNTSRRRQTRANPEIRLTEQNKNTKSRQNARSDLNVRALEQRTNTVSRKRARTQMIPWNQAKENFEKQILEGPTYSCHSCDRLFFKSSIVVRSRESLIEKGCTAEFLEQIIYSTYADRDPYHFCSTCFKCMDGKNTKYPRFNINHSGLAFPVVPEIVKSLAPLEERLVATRIPFMKIFGLGCDRQFGIRGGVVNVPVDVPKMFDAIPIRPDQSGVIHLKLKRKMSMRNYHIYETIRPSAVYEAGKLLVQQPLYVMEGVKLNEQWEQNNTEIFNSDPTEEPPNDCIAEQATIQENENDENELITYSETMLDSNYAVEFAPGEGETPMSLLRDVHCEEFSFPTIFFGHARSCSLNVKLSFDDQINSEIRRTDRRAARPDHLLFVQKKSQLLQLGSNMNIALRKSAQTYSIKVSDVLNNNFINASVNNDSAYKFLQNITGSPTYWENQKKNVLAMVRQLGVFTFFVTLSAAESHWQELLKILKKTVDGEDNADVSELNFEEKSRLIRTDPVTCALYFDHRFKELKKTWINTEDGPFGDYKISHFYHRIEFQQRGSPHVHMLIWIENAPKFDQDRIETFRPIEDFIDRIITTESDDPEISTLIKYQEHNCKPTCRKTVRGREKCRFGAPFFPMDRTRILQPISDEISESDSQKYKGILASLSAMLNGNLASIGSFNDMISKLECSLDDYIMAVRSQLPANKVFLKRDPKDARINGYSKKILMLMRANIDVQFVLDPYACIGYIVDYINKPSRGISKLLRACVESLKNGETSIRDKLKAVSNVFYNGTEISSQEAAWCRLRLHMSSSSTEVDFINTGPAKNRTRILKSQAQLKKLEPDSTDIYKKGPIDRYSERPTVLEDVCLADFIALYNFSGKKSAISDEDISVNADHQIDEMNDILHSEINDEENLRHIDLCDGKLTLRRKRKVIRFVKFDFNKDKENFYRERIMLFMPWRKETIDYENESLNYERIYLENRQIIESKSKEYIQVDLDLTDILKEIENDRAERDDEYLNDENEQDISTPFAVLNYDDNVMQANVMFDLGEESAIVPEAKKFTVPELMNDADYFRLMDTLNVKQRDYVMHVLNAFKLGEIPLYHFVSGEAGVGKSQVIKAIFQSLTRHFRQTPGLVEHPEVLITAYTGKAAHNVGGMTAHTAFSLVMAGDSNKISPDVLNTLRVKLSKLRLVIIDEISMLGSKTFQKINNRLCQIFQSKQFFGGKSVIVLGDFSQLKPVLDEYVFASGKNDLQQLVGNPLWDKFMLFELTEIMRQKDDLSFAQALGRVAKGQSTLEDIKMFSTRSFVEDPNLAVFGKTMMPPEGKKAVRLFWQNQDVDYYNLRRIKEVETENALSGNKLFKFTFEAVDKISGALSPIQKRQAQHNLNGLSTQKTQGLPKSLILQEGIRYMVTSNIDVADGLFNGAVGILRFLEIKEGKAGALYLEFEDPTIGTAARNARKSLMDASSINSRWTPINRVKLAFNVLKRSHAQVIREQYPLVVAEAMTIHKSQGSTLKNVAVNLQKGMERSLIYVALSRVTKLDGLYIVGDFKCPPAPNENHLPTVEMKRLREHASFIPKFTILRNPPSNVIQIVSFNIQSIRKHFDCIKNDHVFLQSSAICLQEIWAMSRENFPMPGFAEIQRNYIETQPKPKGTMIYVRDELNSSRSKAISFQRGLENVDITYMFVENIMLINIYKNPKTTLEYFKTILLDIQDTINYPNVLMVGDFNVDLRKNSQIIEYLWENYHLRLLSPLQPTTDAGTTIDAIFGKIEALDFDTHIYESYCSFHKPLIIRLKK